MRICPNAMLAICLLYNANRNRLCEVPIRIHDRSIDALEILALDERLDTLLHHVDFGLELASQLAEGFEDELLM